jgi:uncharacterized membrane protein
MDKNLIRIINIVTAIFIILGVVLTLLVAAYGREFTTNEALKNKLLNPFLTLTFIIFAIAALAAILFPFFMMLRNPRKLLGIAAILAGFVVLALISYAISHNQFDAEQLQKLKSTPEVSRYVGASLIFTYLVAGFTILAFVVSNVINFFRR